MPVYFVYRWQDGTPSEKHVFRFEFDTILGWAQAVWKQTSDYDEAAEYARGFFGELAFHNFASLFHYTDSNERPARPEPRALSDLDRWFDDFLLEETAHGPHHLQFLFSGDDDRGEKALYVFDEVYRKRNRDKTDFLLLASWELPTGDADGPAPKLPETQPDPHPGDDEGTTYAVSLFAQSKYNLDDLGAPPNINGVRLPDLARHLLTTPEYDREESGLQELRAHLRALLANPTGEDAGFLVAIRDQPEERTNWGAYSDWLQERDLPPAGLHLLGQILRAKECAYGYESRRPEMDRMKVTPHMAQACKHRSRSPESEPDSSEVCMADYYGQWIFFDDRWAAAHPTLAAGILTFASRWDVLT